MALLGFITNFFSGRRSRKTDRLILQSLSRIEEKLLIMATKQDIERLNAAFDELGTAIEAEHNEVVAELKRIQDEEGVDLEPAIARVQALTSKVKEIVQTQADATSSGDTGSGTGDTGGSAGETGGGTETAGGGTAAPEQPATPSPAIPEPTASVETPAQPAGGTDTGAAGSTEEE